MVCYTVTKPPSVVTPMWILEISVIYKPTPITDDKDNLVCIIGNMFDQSSSPAFFKIDLDEIGSCCAIIEHPKILAEFRPEISLQSDSMKDTDWEDAEMEIALVAIPTLAPIPDGKEITSTTLDDSFIQEMRAISIEHGFWAQTMNDVVDQHEVDNHTDMVLKRMIESIPPSSSCNRARAATKGLRGMTFLSNPYVDPSLLNRCSDRFEADQAQLKEFFRRNPTPARVEDVNDDENVGETRVLVRRTTAPSISHPPAGRGGKY